MKQSSRAGSGNKAAEELATPSVSHTHAHTKILWRVQCPRHEKEETEEAKGLKPEKAAGEEATKLPDHHAQKQARAVVDRPGLLAGTGQRSHTHDILLLCV